jgi:hypothetical protein
MEFYIGLNLLVKAYFELKADENMMWLGEEITSIVL